MPIRGMGQMTNGMITRRMTEDIVSWVNGRGLRGLGRLIRDFFLGRKAEAEFYDMLIHPDK